MCLTRGKFAKYSPFLLDLLEVSGTFPLFAGKMTPTHLIRAAPLARRNHFQHQTAERHHIRPANAVCAPLMPKILKRQNQMKKNLFDDDAMRSAFSLKQFQEVQLDRFRFVHSQCTK